ncbi:MAG: HD domain-containing protein [Clostridia bacterium]|nr:HD domain-containing protein [Clostridia bacterium]
MSLLTQLYAFHEPLPGFLSDVVSAPAMQRLKGVGMNCGCEYTDFPQFRSIPSYSRYEHSLGVALIVWHFTGEPAQAVAALLHDVATPAFAHVVDFLKGDSLHQEATESGTRETIESSPEVLAALERRGLSVGEVCDYHRYPIADNPSPFLSADRLEYTFGNVLGYGIAGIERIREWYLDLDVGESESGEPELQFHTPALAETFAMDALQCGMVYACREDRYAMQTLSQLLRDAIASGALDEADLMGTERQVLARLCAQPALRRRWLDFRALSRLEVRLQAGEGNGWLKVKTKKRWIDPLCPGVGRVSSFSQAFRAARDAFLADPQDEWMRGFAP